MLLILISCLPFLLFFPNLLPNKLIPAWVHDMTLLTALLFKEFVRCLVRWLQSYRLPNDNRKAVTPELRSKMSVTNKKQPALVVEEEVDATAAAYMTILDLPDLAIECILGKLSPAGLSRMGCVCSAMREACRSDYFWEKHMRQKWGRLMGLAALREWEASMASRRALASSSNKLVSDIWKSDGWMGTLSSVLPLSCLKSSKCCDDLKPQNTSLPVDSAMYFYLELETGKFWFPAQVYNRENGHAGFLLSCYDADLSYDRQTDTFCARYPPHGNRPAKMEGGIQWDRLRAPPLNTSPHDLHVSHCLNELKPGDHVEIQWRKNKEFPYGWWYGVVGHLESCDKNEQHCFCHKNDKVVLEFNQYLPGSRWRQTEINRKDHQEEGNDTDGFYGGIRKLHAQDEISTWRGLWPTEVLE